MESTPMQKQFQNHTIYKRSKHIIDIQKVIHQQKTQQVIRRSPISSKQTFDTKLYSSFTNTSELYEHKRQTDIKSHRKTYILMDNPQYRYSTIQTSGKSSPRMSKMLSRDTANHSPKPLTNNQNRFNNFTLTQYNPHIYVNINKSYSTSKPSIQSSNQPLNTKHTKEQIYQNIIFDNSLYKCLFDYNKHKRTSKKNLIPKNQQYKQLSNAFDVKPKGQLEFYNRTGRQYPSIVHNQLKTNQYQYSKPSSIKKLMGFSIRKRKQQMIRQKQKDMQKKKQIIDRRDQMCDEKYFRRVHQS